MSADLSRFRVEGEPQPEVEVETFEPEPFSPTFVGLVMAVDQTLAKAGAVLFFVGPGGKVLFRDSTMVKSTAAQGRTDERVDPMVEQFAALIRRWRPDLLAYEMPPPATRMMHNTDSSLAAAVALRSTWRLIAPGRPASAVLAQVAKKRWAGKRGATKAEVGRALEGVWPSISKLRPCNQDIRDAIAVGLVAVERYAVDHREGATHG